VLLGFAPNSSGHVSRVSGSDWFMTLQIRCLERRRRTASVTSVGVMLCQATPADVCDGYQVLQLSAGLTLTMRERFA
jgi:hypothetical protein